MGAATGDAMPLLHGPMRPASPCQKSSLRRASHRQRAPGCGRGTPHSRKRPTMVGLPGCGASSLAPQGSNVFPRRGAVRPPGPLASPLPAVQPPPRLHATNHSTRGREARARRRARSTRARGRARHACRETCPVLRRRSPPDPALVRVRAARPQPHRTVGGRTPPSGAPPRRSHRGRALAPPRPPRPPARSSPPPPLHARALPTPRPPSRQQQPRFAAH
mmetsp:Transcript_18748/g.61309  ORF Transcript_18748/g.61309 Transcript_18748/m.61309 type:complete len:219 (+) Transcript_18748:1500-2156(+)